MTIIIMIRMTMLILLMSMFLMIMPIMKMMTGYSHFMMLRLGQTHACFSHKVRQFSSLTGAQTTLI